MANVIACGLTVILMTAQTFAQTPFSNKELTKKDLSEEYYKLFPNEDGIFPRTSAKKDEEYLAELDLIVSASNLIKKGNEKIVESMENINESESYSRVLTQISDIFKDYSETVQIVLMGGEKAGKSTTLEYLTKTKLTYVNIKRATMAPTIFHFRKSTNTEITINGKITNIPIEKIYIEIEKIFSLMSEIQTEAVEVNIQSPYTDNEFDLVDLPGITADDASKSTHDTVLSIAQPYIDRDNIILYIEPVPHGGLIYTTYISDLRGRLRNRNNVIFVCNRMGDLIDHTDKNPDNMHVLNKRFEEMYSVHDKTDEFYFINTVPIITNKGTSTSVFREKIIKNTIREDKRIRAWLSNVEDPLIRKMVKHANIGIENLGKRVQKWVNERRKGLIDTVCNRLNEVLVYHEKKADSDKLQKIAGINILDDVIHELDKLVKNVFNTKAENLDSTFLESITTEHYRFEKYLTFLGVKPYPSKNVEIDWSSEKLFLGEQLLLYKKLSKDNMRRSIRDMRNRLIAQGTSPNSVSIINKIRGSDSNNAFMIRDAWREMIVDMALSSLISFDDWRETTVHRLSYNLRQIFRGAIWLLMYKHEKSDYYLDVLHEQSTFRNRLEYELNDIIQQRALYTKEFINAIWWQTMSAKIDHKLPAFYSHSITYYYPNLKDGRYSFSQLPCTEIPQEMWMADASSNRGAEQKQAEKCIDEIKLFCEVTFAYRMIKFYQVFDDYVETTWVEPFFKHLEYNKKRSLIQPENAKHIDIVNILRSKLIDVPKHINETCSVREMYGIDAIANNTIQIISARKTLITDVQILIKTLKKFRHEHLEGTKGSLSVISS